MNVLYARNEFKGVLIRCPHCTFSSRHDPDDIGDAIKEGKSVVCGACEKPFHVFVEVAPREAVEQVRAADLGEKAHQGDPCIYCGKDWDKVGAGDCPNR